MVEIFSKETSCESEANHPTVCLPGFLPVSHFKKLDFFFLSFQAFSGLIKGSQSHIVILRSVDGCDWSSAPGQPLERGSDREEMK